MKTIIVLPHARVNEVILFVSRLLIFGGKHSYSLSFYMSANVDNYRFEIPGITAEMLQKLHILDGIEWREET